MSPYRLTWRQSASRHTGIYDYDHGRLTPCKHCTDSAIHKGREGYYVSGSLSVDPEIQSLPKDYGLIRGKVIEEKTGEAITNAKVTIPELNLPTKSDENGNFAFEPIKINPTEGSVQYVTVAAQAPGFGNHTMTDVALAPKDKATVTLAMIKGDKPTKWYGIIRNKAKRLAKQTQAGENDASAFSLNARSADDGSLFSETPGDVRVTIGNSSGEKSGPRVLAFPMG